jgi:UDP-glucose 4-epimerase
MMMRVAVTGGSGFIGSHVVDHLLRAGYEVRVLDRLMPVQENVEWVPSDITRVAELTDALQDCGAVFHLAAMANVNDVAAAPFASVELNVLGTAAVLEAARLAGVGRFVLASTVWVYEASGETEVDHATPLNLDAVKHLYTAEKASAEMLAHGYAQLYHLPVTILRYGIPYGPRMREQLVLPIFIKQALQGKPLTIAGDGLQYRNFVYVEDLADAHVRVLEHEATGTFNLEGPRDVSIKELAETVTRLVPGSAGVVYTEGRNGDYQGRRVSYAHTSEQIGWAPSTTFEQGVEKTVTWFLAKWAPQPATASPAAV